MALILRLHCQLSLLFAGSSPARGKVTVAQLALQVSLITAIDEYLFLKFFSSVFLTAENPIKVNYYYGRLDFSLFSGGDIILCLFP